MRSTYIFFLLATCLSFVFCTVHQNGQVRVVDYPDTMIASVSGKSGWVTYPPNASEISYKGRWDAKHISCKLILDWVILARSEDVIALYEICSYQSLAQSVNL